jgi:hypothetical protein
MRVPIYVTVLLLAAAAGLGWHGRQQLAALRVTHAELVQQAAARMISPIRQALPKEVAPRTRTDSEADARWVLAEFLAKARELGPQGDKLWADDATRKRVDELMGLMNSLRGKQLVIVIDEVLKANDVEDRLRGKLFNLVLHKLGEENPQLALTLFTDRPGLLALYCDNSSDADHFVSVAAPAWVKLDPDAATAWFKRNKHQLNDELFKVAAGGITHGLKTFDPLRALEFAQAEAPGYLKESIEYLFADNGEAPENRDACLAALRQWSAGIANETERNEMRAKALRCIAFGTGLRNETNFNSVSRWIEAANLSATELGFLSDEKVIFHFKREDAGHWIAWLEGKIPPDIARERTLRLFSEWTARDPLAAGNWLTNAPESASKRTAARAYAETVFPYDRDTAIQWVLTLPDGGDRDHTLKSLYEAWPKDDPEGAAAFAVEHGIK